MRYDKVQRNATPESLSPAQTTAIGALLSGKTITDAANDAGVDRATVHRWLKDDYVFQAEINRSRKELRSAAYHRLERLAGKAADCVEKAVDGGDVKAAFEVLKALQVLGVSIVGSEDASALERKRRMDELME